jgi:uncharacterized protein (DUF1330 family)
MPIHPTEEQIMRLAGSTDTGPILMLNLLKFKEHADGIDEGVSGAEAYARYSAGVEPFLRGVGGSLRTAAVARESVVGPVETEWDLILLVEYPSRAKFIEMATNPDYLKIHAHREAALSDSRLILCSGVDEAGIMAMG